MLPLPALIQTQLKEERWNRPPPGKMPSTISSHPCTTGAYPNSLVSVPGPLAEVYADRIDWHQIARLVCHGCPPRLALRIAC